jgi:phospholipid/cholesterol/gamma-HCH transport system permease protein
MDAIFHRLNFFRIFFYLRDLFQIILTSFYDLGSILVKRRSYVPLLLQQILSIGFDAIPILTIVGLLLGMGTVAEAGLELPKLGIQNLVGTIIIHIILRIVGPFATAMVVIARSASAISVEIGNMRVSGELDTIEMLGVNLSFFLITPRIVGVLISTMALTFYFAICSFTGGFLMGLFGLSMPMVSLIESLKTSLTLSDLLVPLMDSAAFGLIIAAVAVYHGLSVGQSPNDVPRETNKALVNAIVLCTLVLTVIQIFLIFA